VGLFDLWAKLFKDVGNGFDRLLDELGNLLMGHTSNCKGYDDCITDWIRAIFERFLHARIVTPIAHVVKGAILPPPKGRSLILAHRAPIEVGFRGGKMERRNLTPDAFKLLLGRRYNRTKKPAHGRTGRDFSGNQFEPPKTAESLAKQHGVSPATVKRADQPVLYEKRCRQVQTVYSVIAESEIICWATCTHVGIANFHNGSVGHECPV